MTRVLRKLTGCYLVYGLCVFAQAFAQNPVPFVAQPLVPASVSPGHAGFILTVHGTGFLPGATVHWNGAPLNTIFISNSQLTADVPAANLTNAGTAQVTVLNPGNNAPSNAVAFSVAAPITTVLYNHAPGSPIFQGTGGTQLVEPASLVTADFNGDGKLDLAVGLQMPGTVGSVNISLGTGDGTFIPFSSSVVSHCPCALAVGDVDGNGSLDLAVLNLSSSNDSSIVVLLNNGNGTFTQAPGTIAASANAASLALADFDGDHNLDLAVANTIDDTVSIFSGNGDGSFTLASSPAAPTAFGMAVGDFNADGNLDLAVTRFDDRALTILLGDGDGTFTAAGSPTTPQSENVVAADFNGDGKLDLAVGNRVDSTAAILLGKGDGTFVPVNNCCGTSVGSTRTFVMVAGDFNSDGKPDLALSIQNANPGTPVDYVAILLGNGDGTFSPTNFTRVLHTDVFSLTAGDFNGDGRLDFATGSEPEDFVSVLLQTGLSTPAPDFGLTFPGMSATVKAGDTATFATQLQSQNGFLGKPSFQCSGLPQFAQCAFPDSVFLFDGVTASFNMTVSTRAPNAPAAVLRLPHTGGLPWWPVPLAGTLLVAMLLVARRKTGRWLAPAAMLGFAFLAGCGGGSMSPVQTGTPPGQYQVTVTVTSGNVTHSTKVTLTVN